MRTIRIRLAFIKPSTGRYLAPLSMILAIPVIAQTFQVNSFFPAPYAQYGRLMTTGIAGNHTLLARFGGGVGIGLPAVTPPAAALSVAGPTLVYTTGNPATIVNPPAPPPVFGATDSLSVSGPLAGLSMATPGTLDWAIYNWGGNLYFWNNATGPGGRNVLQVAPDGRTARCAWSLYWIYGTWYCPGVGPLGARGIAMTTWGPIVDDSTVGWVGWMLCCDLWGNLP